MSRTIEQVRDILYGSPRWNAGLQWYDFLLAIAFHQDRAGEMCNNLFNYPGLKEKGCIALVPHSTMKNNKNMLYTW